MNATNEDAIMGMLSSLTKEMKEVKATTEGLKQGLEELKTTTKAILDATPGAAAIPEVYVLGDESVAKQRGSSATWTLVKARTADCFNRPTKRDRSPRVVSPETVRGNEEKQPEESYTYFLVSSAHCVHRIANSSPHSVIFLCSTVGKFLATESNAGHDGQRMRVLKVGFHHAINRVSHEKQKAFFFRNPTTDIVYLELEGEPPVAVLKQYVVPLIDPNTDVAKFHSVAGRALSGRLNGTGLQKLEEYKGMMSFVSNFSEDGCSGTVMYGLPPQESCTPALGCFKGHVSYIRGNKQDRGWFVRFLQWKEIQWTPVVVQLRAINKNLSLCTDEPAIQIAVSKDCSHHRGRKYVLTLEERSSFEFEGVPNNSSSSDDDDADSDYSKADSECY